MSEFYQERRVAIKDLTGYMGFVIGFLGSAPFAWQYLSSYFEANDPSTGLLYFVLIILAAGAIVGTGGLLLGTSAGFVWEQVHRWRRPPSRDDTPVPAMAPRAVASAAPSVAAASSTSTAVAEPATARGSIAGGATSIRYDDHGFAAAPFLALAQRVWPNDYDATRASAALKRTLNIGAWDGDRLIGAVRVLTDGYFLATIPEILVDPEYQGHGVGRELMHRALALAPRGALFFGARPQSVGFFEKLGCERGPEGFIMRRPGSPAS